MNTLGAFLKKPTTIAGIVTAVMFQLIFGLVWMTGYDGVTERVDALKIAVVSEDEAFDQNRIENLRKNLPFDVQTAGSPETARKLLNEREVQMVLHIPANFSARLQAPDERGRIHYIINESNPAMIKSTMSAAAESITAAVNREAVAAGVQSALVGTQVPGEQAAGIARQLSERVEADIEFINPVAGMANQMIPMMLVLASYVGAMIMAMNMEQSSLAIGSGISKWRKFAVRGILHIAASVVVALAGTSMMFALGGESQSGFWQVWAFQTLFVMTFMFTAQFFLLLFGVAGMLFNIILLSLQLVSSGAMVPREMLSAFYRTLGDYLPATYAVEGTMNLLFGGPGIGSVSLTLVWIMLAAILAGLLAVAIRKEQPLHEPKTRLKTSES